MYSTSSVVPRANLEQEWRGGGGEGGRGYSPRAQSSDLISRALI
jgi:hypothetical protein